MTPTEILMAGLSQDLTLLLHTYIAKFMMVVQNFKQAEGGLILSRYHMANGTSAKCAEGDESSSAAAAGAEEVINTIHDCQIIW